MADDGNRQIAISLSLSAEQFAALDTKLGGIDGAINKLAENISEPDTNLAAEVSLLRNELGMRLTAINESINAASANLGKWLSAIALAASTPEDNSAEVQRQIDQFTAQLKTGTDELEAAVKANQPK
jgi:uncharacterized protein YPO0396